MVLSIVPRVHDAVRHELAVGLRFGSLLHPVTDDQSHTITQGVTQTHAK